MRRTNTRVAVVILVAAALSTCSEPAAVEPATIAAAPNVPTTVSAAVGASLPSAQLPAVIVMGGTGNAMSGVRVAFRASAGTISADGATASSAVSTMTDASGIARLTSWTMPSSPGTATVTAAIAGTNVNAVFTVVITAAAAARLDKSAGDAQSATVNAVLPTAVAVIARDQDGNPVADATVAFTVGANSGAVSNGGGSFASTVTATTDGSGIATASWRLGTQTGSNTLTASAPNVTPVTFSATGQAGTATHLVVVSPPSSVSPSGATFGAQPAIQRRDQFENAVPVNGVSVTASVPAGYSLVGTSAAPTASTGTATFTNLGVSGPTGPVTITFSSAGVTAATASVTIGAGATSSIAPNVATTLSGVAGSAVGAAQLPGVVVRDAANNPVPGVGVTFTVSGGTITTPSGSAPPSPSVTATSDASGVARLTSWTLPASAGTATVSAALAGASGSPVTYTATVTPGTASSLTKAAGDNQSATVNTPVTTAPSVVVKDASNNAVPNAQVTFTVATGGGAVSNGGAFSASVSVTTNASGAANVNWRLGTTAGANTLTASVSGAPSVSFTATGTAGAATQLVVVTAPSSPSPSGAAFTTQPAIQRRDQFGNPVLTGGVSVTASVPAGYSLVGGTGATTAGTGTATFTDLGVSGSTGPVTLTFSSAGVTSATAAVTIGAGTTASISPNVGTTLTGVAGSAVAAAQLPAVVVRDGASNPVSGAAVTFSVSGGTITTASGSAPPSASVTATTDASGIARLTSWTLPATVGTATVSAALSGATGSPVTFTATVTAGAATQLVVVTAPNSPSVSGAAFTTQPAVQRRDQFGNPVLTSGVSVSASVPTGFSLVGASSATTAGTGTATFADLGVSGAAGSVTITFASGSLTTTASVNVTASAPGQIQIVAGDNQQALAGAAVAVAPSVKVVDGTGNPASGVAVSFTVPQTGGGGGTAQPASVTTNASGVATVTSWVLGNQAAAQLLNVSANGLSASFHATSLAQLTVAPSGTNSGAGSVTGNGFNCAIPASGSATGTCVLSFSWGTAVTLTAAPSSGYQFSSWTGVSGCTTATSCLVTLNQSATTSVGATFAPTMKTIIIHNSASSTANGTVTSNPGSINCTVTPTGTSGTCSQSFTSLTSVTLTETPSGGGTFSGWQGACTGSNSTCTLSSVVTGNQDVTAVFGAPASSTYSRDFSTLANQSPISDGGAWTSLGRLLGVDWDDVAVTNGVAHGVYVNSQLRQYADPTALLGGVWSPNQEAEAVIKGVDAIPAGCNQEVELRLRSSVLLHSNSGYEVIFQMKSSATTGGISYIQVVRWNGLLGDWTSIYIKTGYSPRDGDRIRARIVGSTISVYYNDVLQDTVVDGTYATGSPGMGFYISPFNVSSCFASPGAFGLTSFTARNLP